jgi:hypothetical protein
MTKLIITMHQEELILKTKPPEGASPTVLTAIVAKCSTI